MDGLHFVVLIPGIGVKELTLTIFSWRAAVIPAVAALSLLSGQTKTLQACCGWFGFDWGAGYAPAYTAGYYGGGYGYTSYYAPAYYGGYDNCGCDPCGCAPACGLACNSCCAAGPGCSSCVGGNCGVTYPGNPNGNPPRPAPDDGFRSVPENRDRTPPPDPADTDSAPPRRNSTFDNPPDESTLPPRRRSRNDGLDNTRGNRGNEPESEPATNNDSIDSEFAPRNNTTRDRFESNRPPMDDPSDANSPSTPPDDSFDSTDDSETKTNKPELGKPGNPDTIIPGRKKPAPTDAEPKEEKSSDIELPKELDLDEKKSSSGVAPKTRLALSSRIGTPSIVRLKLRPTRKWLADPQPEMIARH